MSKSAEAAEASMLENLKTKTGKSIDQWVKISKASKIAKHGELVKYLKSDHGLTHGYANLVAIKTLNPEILDPSAGGALIDAQYAGTKAALRPIYDAVIVAVEKFGKDVEVAPKKGYVSLRRNKQFAIIQATTQTRVDVGINLKGATPTKRLLPSGSFNAMVSHRVSISDKSEVDAELRRWLKQAYDAS